MLPVTAAEIKAALRRRHSATTEFGAGPWTCIEEWMQIDLLAFAAWTQPKPARCRHARIGYEVKVSRSDYRRELAKPSKRAAAVAFCHEFYFAVPQGLLAESETAWVEPAWDLGPMSPFRKLRCPGAFGASCADGKLSLGTHWRPTAPERRERLPWLPARERDYSRTYEAECPTCRGSGWVAESPAVRAGAPKLWVPADVGLVELSERGAAIVRRKAPLNREPSRIADAMLTDLVRWVSVRPDPRHAELRERSVAA